MSPDAVSPDTASQALGSNLRRLRADAGLTQAVVAQRAGIARSHYAALESGASSNGGPANPRLNTLIDLSVALGAPLEAILSQLTPGGRPGAR